MSTWHSESRGAVLSGLETDRRRGLSEPEARRRLSRYGPNRLERRERPSLLRRLWGELRDPMILVLLASAALSFWAGGGEDWLDSAIILLIVVVNAAISLSQADNAEKALSALRRLSAPVAQVIREGHQRRVEAQELVPGDLVVLEAGDLIPADGRLLESVGLRCDESAMTGESAPVWKDAEGTCSPEAPMAERPNMVLASTVVTAGRGTFVVTETGMHTEVGRIAGLLLRQEEGETPIQKKMGEVSRTLSFLCLAVCAVMFGTGLILHSPMLEMFLTAVSLAVAAIPEGLPAVVSIVLALGVSRMAERGAIMKHLPAVETLGCAEVICSDKTGTLTQNRMTVTELWTPSPADRDLALTAGALCSEARLLTDERGRRTAVGDPTETALLELAVREGLDPEALREALPLRRELPFDSDRKRMSTVHARREGGFRVLVKGAPDVLLDLCRLTDGERRTIEARNRAMAGKALRVLGLACRDLSFLPPAGGEEAVEQELHFLGLAGMMDPPRPGVKEAIDRCHAAGIRPVMMTGDHKLTAVAIARALGLLHPGALALTGADLDFMPQEMLEEVVERTAVFARVTPEHKLRIVRAWQKRGKVVAMTGDGVNDAPALKASDIGCAMGKGGTDVAKGAADMVLTDDDFTTIVSAVEEGRGIYANIRKAIHYLLSCNIGEVTAVFLATLFHLEPMVLSPVQLLWLNLVTDSLPALALGVEPVEPGSMDHPPRPSDRPLFDRAFSLRLVRQGLMVGLLTLGAYLLGAWTGGGGTANTMAFATLTLSQLFHAFDVRSEERPLRALGLRSNPAMVRAFLVGAGMQLSVLCIPGLRSVFGTVALTALEWGLVLLLALTPFAVCEAGKVLRHRNKRHARGKREAAAGAKG